MQRWGGRIEMILPAIGSSRSAELQVFKEVHFAQKTLFLNLAQVGAIKCKRYRIRPMEGGNFQREKIFELRNGAEYFELVRGEGPCCVRCEVTRVAKLQGYMSKCVDGLNVKREGCRMCVRT